MNSVVPSSHIISPAELSRILESATVVVLDATVPYGPSGPDAALGRTRWEQAHIPRSRYADLQNDLSDPSAPFSFTFPALEHLAEKLRGLGVHDEVQVVIYDDFLNMWATRLWWMLRAVGFERAAVLDGGWKAWKAAGLPVASGPSASDPASKPLSLRPQIGFVDIEKVEQAAGSATPLVCALPESYFRGEDKVNGRGGHIPGSLNIPAATLLDEEGRFLPETELRRRLQPLASAPETILYCGGGISATLLAFALDLIGQKGVHVYDGSLEEWNSDPTRPLAV